ncbi:phosphotransferase family protein [Nocardioides sp. Root140]|uniref:phosphotransferase family protein n=1 Tax=Nocardioides sp. Root140 TaxID=1736460 RepID=UPI000A41EFC2|nr:phosphotransferase [Nocardioides sp. Root140]
MTTGTALTESAGIAPDQLAEAMRASGAAAPQAVLRRVEARPIGNGLMADTLLLALEWREGAGPASAVAKVPSTDEAAARTAASLGAYEREASFYLEFVGESDIDVPALLGVIESSTGAPTLLLEDLSALSARDQLEPVGLDVLEQMRAQLAALQAPFWGSARLAETPWLHRRLGVPIPGIVERMQGSWAKTRDYLADGYDDEERAQIDRFVAGAGGWAERVGGPVSLVHHDYRIDNMLFGPDRVVVLDWQTVGWGAPMFDLAYAMATSLAPDTRAQVERDVVRTHVADLFARGVEFDEDEAWRAYREASFATLLMLVPPTGSVKRTERGDQVFRDLLRRGARIALDLGADEFLG